MISVVKRRGEMKALIWFLVCLTKAITFNLTRTVSPFPGACEQAAVLPQPILALINGGHLQPLDQFVRRK